MKNVKLAKSAGFCMGVSLALHKLDQALHDKSGEVALFTLGPIIHNPQVLNRYKDAGVRQLSVGEDFNPGDIVVIRAHGVPRELEQKIEAKGALIVDATCPKVKKAQTLIEEQARSGRTLYLYGEPDHPEVKGLVSYAGGRYEVYEKVEDLLGAIPDSDQVFIAAQTTQDRDDFERLKKRIGSDFRFDIPILDTVCNATKQRQAEVLEIASEVDFMVIVGGYASGNTRRLAKVAASTGVACAHVETEQELPVQDLSKAFEIGVSAGASTPDTIIAKVVETLQGL